MCNGTGTPNPPAGTEANTMRLYIVRHGKAEQESPSGRDADRPLKPKGVKQAKHLGECFAQAARRPALILTSGYSRAIHTATIIQTALGCPLDSAIELESGKPVSAAIDLIAKHAGLKDLMFVGHNPQLGMLVGALTVGLGASELLLKTGEAVVLDVPVTNPIGSGRIVDRARLEDALENYPFPTSGAGDAADATPGGPASLRSNGGHSTPPQGKAYFAGGGWVTTPSLRLSLRR